MTKYSSRRGQSQGKTKRAGPAVLPSWLPGATLFAAIHAYLWLFRNINNVEVKTAVIVPMLVTKFLRRGVKLYPKQTAVVCGEKRFSYA